MIEAFDPNRPDRATSLHGMKDVLDDEANHECNETATVVRQNALGNTLVDTARSLSSMAVAYDILTMNFDKVLELCEQVLEVQ
eukprot:m.315742 g.315742  ORF g.315742 m.315742 type:complete len:83 (-) comp15975_c0_seq1:169-417(-)